MNDLKLTGHFKVLGIKKKTKAVFFRDLEVGDVVEVSYSFGGSYENAPTVKLLFNDTIHFNNSLQFTKNLENFETELV